MDHHTTNSYDDWISLYDDAVHDVWSKEPHEMKKVAMLNFTIRKELARIQDELQKEMNDIREAVSRNKDSPKRDSLKEISVNNSNKENVITTKASPKRVYTSSANIQSSDTAIECPPVSPTIKSKRNLEFKRRRKVTTAKALFPIKQTSTVTATAAAAADISTDIFDCSIIDCTPQVAVHPLRKQNNKSKKQTPSSSAIVQNQATLTKMFSSGPTSRTNVLGSTINEVAKSTAECNSKNNNDDNQTNDLDIEDMLNLINQTTQVNDDSLNDDDATNIDLDVVEDKTRGEQLNKIKPQVYNIPSSFAAKYNQVPKRKTVAKEPSYAYQGDVVRGKERKKLPGWTCKECEKFYQALDLSPDTIRKKINGCSRHRSKFQPLEETLPGFWDLTLRATQEVNNNNKNNNNNNNTSSSGSELSMVFNYKRK